MAARTQAGGPGRLSQFSLRQLLFGICTVAGACALIKAGSASFQILPIFAGLLAGGWIAKSKQSVGVAAASLVAIVVFLVYLTMWFSIYIACLSVLVVGFLPLFVGCWRRRAMVAGVILAGVISCSAARVIVVRLAYSSGFDDGCREMLAAARTPGGAEELLRKATISHRRIEHDALSPRYSYWCGYSSGIYRTWHGSPRAAGT